MPLDIKAHVTCNDSMDTELQKKIQQVDWDDVLLY